MDRWNCISDRVSQMNPWIREIGLPLTLISPDPSAWLLNSHVPPPPRYASGITLVFLVHRSTPPHSRLPLTQHPPLHQVLRSSPGPVVVDRGELQFNVYVVMDRFSGNFRSPPILCLKRCKKTWSRGVACPLFRGWIGSSPSVFVV